MWQNAFAYNFSAVAPSGQTLYYNLVTGGVSVTCPGYDYSGYTRPTGNLTIPSTVSSVTIPNSVTYISNYAFSGCRGLTSVTIPNSVTYIFDNAFSGCSGLTSVTIPNSVTSIGDNVFYGCSGLTSVTIPNSVTSIGSSAFSDCSGLISVTIPNSVTYISNYAFSDCRGLTSVIIPNSVTYIGNSAFRNVRYIEYYGNATGAPWGAISMNGVTDGDFVFSNTDRDTLIAYSGAGGAVTIPSSVTTIGNNAFYGCSGLTSVTIGNSVTSIGSSAFYGCSGLTSVTIPNSVTSIGNSAFHGCSGLTSVTIGNSVTSIGNQAFSGCSGLTEIHSEASVAPLLGTDCFAGVPINIPVYIPCGSQMSYYSRWSYFSNFVEAAGFSFSATSADETMGSVTVLTQPTCQSPTAVINATPAAGYLFLQWNNGVTDNPYSLVVTSDTALSAIFVSANDTPCDTVYIYIHDTVYIHDTIYITGEGIGGADAMNAKVYTSQGQIVVEGADGNTVTLYDVTGRVLATKQDYGTAIRFDIPASGTYMIKIGNHTARKVVVVR